MCARQSLQPWRPPAAVPGAKVQGLDLSALLPAGPQPLPPPGPSPASPTGEPATHLLPRCPQTLAAAAADTHLRRKDSARAGSSLHPAWCDGKGVGRSAYPPRQKTGIQAADMVVEGLLGPGRQGECEGGSRERRPLRPHHTAPALPLGIPHPSETQGRWRGGR